MPNTNRHLLRRILKADSTSDRQYRPRARATQITTVSPRGWSCVTPASRIGFSMLKANGKRNSATSMSFRSIDEEIPLDKDTNALGQKYTIGPRGIRR